MLKTAIFALALVAASSSTNIKMVDGQYVQFNQLQVQQQQLFNTQQFPPGFPGAPPAVNNNNNNNAAVTTTSTNNNNNNGSSSSSSSNPCDATRNTANQELITFLSTQSIGCIDDRDCAMTEVSTLLKKGCPISILTSNSEAISNKIFEINQKYYTETFTAQCPEQNQQQPQNCGTLRAICNKSKITDEQPFGICDAKNKYVALGAEINGAPGSVLGIGTNTRGIDGSYINNVGVVIATSTIPTPTFENVNNVINNIPIVNTGVALTAPRF